MRTFYCLILIVVARMALSQEARPVYDGIDREVSNVGGKAELKRMFEQELQYPEASLRKKEGGKVTMRFLVSEDGSVSDLKVTARVNPEIDAEALRIFRKVCFLPLIYRGANAKTYHEVTFVFDAGKYAKVCKKRGYTVLAVPEPSDTGSVISTGKEKNTINPEFPDGGEWGLKEFIRKNLEYPTQAQVQNFSGTVELSFVVEPHGRVTNIQVERSVAGGCNEEAIRVLQLIRWQPGKRDGKAARVKRTISVTFALQNINRDNTIGEQR